MHVCVLVRVCICIRCACLGAYVRSKVRTPGGGPILPRQSANNSSKSSSTNFGRDDPGAASEDQQTAGGQVKSAIHDGIQLESTLSSSAEGDATDPCSVGSKDAAMTIHIPLSDYQHFRQRRRPDSTSPVRLGLLTYPPSIRVHMWVCGLG